MGRGALAPDRGVAPIAIYDVTVVVTCADQAEYDRLKTHLVKHGADLVARTPPTSFASLALDDAGLAMTLTRSDQVDGMTWDI